MTDPGNDGENLERRARVAVDRARGNARKLVIGAASIVLFGLLSVALIAVVTRAPGDPAPAPLVDPGASSPPPLDWSAPPPPPPRELAALRPELNLPQPPPAPVVPGPPRRAELPGTWEAIPPVARASALGPLGAALGRELAELQPRLSACFDEDTQARYGPRPFTRVADQAPLEDHGTTVLMLELEARDGEVQIVDAPVEARGAASDGLIACAQSVLRGHALATPEARRGARHRILFTLLQ